MTLPEKFEDSSRRALLNLEICTLIQSEVSEKKGVTGLALKGGLKMLTATQPGALGKIVERLLDDSLHALCPFHEQAHEQGALCADFFESKQQEVAEALLQVTDRRAERASNQALLKIYGRLRPTALGHVAQAAGAMGEVLDRFERPSLV